MFRKLMEMSTRHPKIVIWSVIVFMILTSLMIVRIRVDTDPENMLSENEFVRVFHNEVKHNFSLYDMLILGIVNEQNPDGVFNTETLKNIYDLTEYISGIEGVIEEDLIAPSTVDNIEQGGPGTVTFEWLMNEPPQDREGALAIQKKVMNNPLLYGTLVSETGKALCLYIPLKEKKLSYHISQLIKKKIATIKGNDTFYITGLPVAEDTFGIEMFIQMAVSAPLAGLVIFLLLWVFFRKIALILSPMAVAIVSVLSTMGLLIGTGNTVHIMSSMIPIFLMPIAVVDSVHILSEFFDRCKPGVDRHDTITHIMQELFTPMLYTSLTSAVGFASLALTPIPPVQIFGIFVAIGIMIAWLLTMTFIPAYIMVMPQKTIDTFGQHSVSGHKKTFLAKLLDWTGHQTYERAKFILVLALIIIAVSLYGISKITINDNPVKWFNKSHPIREADTVLNKHFGGTYMAYLVLTEDYTKSSFLQFSEKLQKEITVLEQDLEGDLPEIKRIVSKVRSRMKEITTDFEKKGNYNSREYIQLLWDLVENEKEIVPDSELEAWDEVSLWVDDAEAEIFAFKNPAMLSYIEQLQQQLLQTGIVGKTTSVSDIVKKVYLELMGGDKTYNRIPDSNKAIAQCLISFQNSHKPNYLWHMVTPSYDQASIWIQLKSGDNKDMEAVTRVVDTFIKNNPPPLPVSLNWAGLTYLNVVWQEKMVFGMLRSFMGSFIIVLVMMIFLFRSLLWGLLSMIPLTITIGFIYGLIGYTGKDYDMPIAVLSALTLGLSVDFSIHFIERARSAYAETGSWKTACGKMFGEPAVAISRNAIVIAIGFLPLLAAPLIPYKTVGFFLAAIMAVSGTGTLFILPSLITVMEKVLFKKREKPVYCNCFTCFTSSAGITLLVSLLLHRYLIKNWTILTFIGAILVVSLMLTCYKTAQSERCKLEK